MKIFYDTEFIEDGETIRLISIGMIAEDGRELYYVNQDISEGLLYMDIVENEWLMKNVIRHLPLCTTYPDKPQIWEAGEHGYDTAGYRLNDYAPEVQRPYYIAQKVSEFIRSCGSDVELWADYGAYDHVVLAQLWGKMINLPSGVPMFTHEFQQYRKMFPLVLNIPESGLAEHNALNDAKYLRFKYQWLNGQFPLHD